MLLGLIHASTVKSSVPKAYAVFAGADKYWLVPLNNTLPGLNGVSVLLATLATLVTVTLLVELSARKLLLFDMFNSTPVLVVLVIAVLGLPLVLALCIAVSGCVGIENAAVYTTTPFTTRTLEIYPFISL